MVPPIGLVTRWCFVRSSLDVCGVKGHQWESLRLFDSLQYPSPLRAANLALAVLGLRRTDQAGGHLLSSICSAWWGSSHAGVSCDRRWTSVVVGSTVFPGNTPYELSPQAESTVLPVVENWYDTATVLV